ncbi:phosphatidylinositol-glycan biosynthesis class X protein [Pelobates fuscus]|uniref:phosphatidylinositol-glycan biosynthesis class X protein n=1 Tax=Pelobates fuscus TaxID=191477 RepID=UPI002FE46B19
MPRLEYVFSCFLMLLCAVRNPAADASCPGIVVQREILNRGFHRDLVTRLDLHTFAEQVDSCRVHFLESIPSGLFLDPYQLSSLRQHNFTDVFLLTAVDLEAPEYLATEQKARVYAKPDPAVCAHCFSSIVPIHTRYHQPSYFSEASITLQSPQLLIHCNKDFPPSGCTHYPVSEAPCGLEDDSVCSWLHLPYTAVPKTIIMQVPVGMTQHKAVVCTVTIAVTLICAGMILLAVYKHDH